MKEMVGSVVTLVAAAPDNAELSYAAAVSTDLEAVVTLQDDLQINDDGHDGLQIDHDSPPTSTSGVLKINHADLVGLLAIDDGHPSDSVAAVVDSKISD